MTDPKKPPRANPPKAKVKPGRRGSLAKQPKRANSSLPPRPPNVAGSGPSSTPGIAPAFPLPSAAGIMSQRHRSGRGSNRNNGGGHGEEVQLWEMAKQQIHEVVTGVNTENDNLAELLKLDAKTATATKNGGGPTGADLATMEQLCRSGVRLSETNSNTIRALIEQLTLLKAVQQANHKEATEALAAPTASRTGGSSRNRETASAAAAAAAAASSLYDFDGAGDSPVPSPISSGRKYGDRSSNRDSARESNRDSNRDSIPPKADSVEPQGSTGSGTAGSSSGVLPGSTTAGNGPRGKITFSKGDKVAFKRKKEEPQQGDPPYDWILGEVVGVIGEGKSRRYKCLDVEPEDPAKAKEFKTFASNMIPIPLENSPGLSKLEPRKMVLALYPQTTAFYAANVESTEPDGVTVNLKFHGENDSTTTHQVERRYVLEYRP
ncbi:SAGA-associated factor 29 like protein [Verticillium longisporum]|uniref:SAGA-associated factor 29 like protein n=1 Tax=Verticillium longisporum TaxID=100787 RepID=A0A8I2Z8Z3_VERLO|nr:SAGA-associated factor 29 like protein [Verticillium longisporum]